MKKFRVAYNTHKESDTSDTCRLQFRNILAEDEQEAMQQVRDMKTVGHSNIRYIGMVHGAEEIG